MFCVCWERLAVDAVLRSVARPIYVPVEVTASTLKRLREEDRTAYNAVPSVEESFFRSEIFKDENDGLLGNQTLSIKYIQCVCVVYVRHRRCTDDPWLLLVAFLDSFLDAFLDAFASSEISRKVLIHQRRNDARDGPGLRESPEHFLGSEALLRI